jgi:TonB family protein
MSATSQTGAEPTGPKVLRIGIVQRGKIIDERELKKRETVSLGTSDKATFSVAADGLSPSFDLFEYDGKDYWLRLAAGLEVRVAVSGGSVQDLEALRREGKVVKRGAGEAIGLNDQSRGKVSIGEVSVLFQFKTAAATPPKPVLPPELRGSLLQSVDAQFAAIFVVVAVLHISFVTYARSLPYIEPSSVEHIDQSFQKFIMPDRAPEPPKEAVAEAGEQAEKEVETEKEAEKPKPKAETKAKADDAEKTPADAEAEARARKEAVTKAVAGKGLLSVIGAKGKSEGAVADVFSEGGTSAALGDALSGIQGVDVASSAGQTGTRGGGSGQGVGIGDLATSGGGSVTAGGKGEEVALRGEARSETPEVDGALAEAEISKVLKRNMGGLRDCYERALKRDRKLAGKVTINFEITEEGRTSNIEVTDTMGSGEVRACIKDRVRSWRFPKPDGGSVMVTTPIVFAPAAG